MGCKYIYKDADGKTSAIYTRALEKYGPERAEEIYLHHMMSTLDTRFSKPLIENLEKKAEMIHDTPDTDSNEPSVYIETKTGKIFGRVTQMLADWTESKSEFLNLKPKTLETAKRDQAEVLIKRTIPVEKATQEEKDAYYKEKITATPDLIERAKIDVQSKWNASTKWGTEFHATADVISKEMESEYLKQDADSEGNRPQINLRRLPLIIEEAKKNMGVDRYREGSYIKDKFETSQLMYIFKPLYEAIQTKERQIGKHLTLKSEQRIYTDQLKDPNMPYDGIGGSIDLIAMTTDNSVNISFDFKTKDADKVVNFENAVGTEIHGPFDGIENSPKNKATAQQLMYGAILKKYGINLTDTMTIVVPLHFQEGEDSGDFGHKTYTIQSIGKDPIIYPMESVGNKVENVLTYFRTGSMPKYYEHARANGPSGVVEKWSGNDKHGSPNATFSKYHKESYIVRKFGEIRTTSTGKKVIDFMNDRVDVSKMDPEAVKSLLSRKYDEVKDTQANAGKDIIAWFESPEHKFPPRLHGKEITVSNLMRGIRPETHTLKLAQGEEGLEGIGPDVLIATNTTTGAISLLSAVSVVDTVITEFKGNGSDDKHTTFLGNYVADKDIISGELNDKLMTAPSTHDYIGMKLGITALYLNKMAKVSNGKINIDIMRIGTILPGDRIYKTDITPEEVFDKLKLFQKYAGKDFPQEYTELLNDVEGSAYKMATADHLKNLMLQIADSTDPLGKMYSVELKGKMINVYKRWQAGELVGTELKKLLGKYVQTVAMRLTPSMTSDQILLDPRYQAASKAFLEYLDFDNVVTEHLKDRVSLPFIRGAVTSGDKHQLKLHVVYNEGSAVIRKQMDAHMDEHKVLLDALRKEKGGEYVGTTNVLFKNMFMDASADPTKRMMLKKPGTAEFNALSLAEQNYIRFFNKSIKNSLMRIATDTKRPDIDNERFWEEGSVPILRSRPELLKKENFESWASLKDAVTPDWLKSKEKRIKPDTRSLLEFDYTTQFDNQANDGNVGHSNMRRSLLGLSEPSNPGEMSKDIEQNLALIINMGALQASEKENYSILLQTVAAMQAITAADGMNGRMSSDMIETWKNLIIFDRKNEESTPGLAKAVDTANQLSSRYLFSLSIKQAMIEGITGTMQNTSSLISNSIQNAVSRFVGLPENSGRFSGKDWLWATKAWDKYDHKLEQMVYDAGMLQADANDLQTAEFRAQNKTQTFYHKAGFWLNTLFFNTAINHTFLAQAKAMGIVDAYVNSGTKEHEKWTYDETKDKRFFAYDPTKDIGDKPPMTDDEKKRFSLWEATRKTLDKEGMLDQETKRMLSPVTANQRAEMKNYATRLYGSFNKDVVVNGEAQAVGRAMFRYKKWFTQRISNYWTPTIRNEAMYGHWEQIKDPNTGEWNTHWMGDDFEGVLQTLGFMGKELMRTRSLAFTTTMGKYRRENLSKLTGDMIMLSIMGLITMPFLADKDEEVDAITGETKTVTGTFGKSMLGKSAYAAALNGVSDMSIIWALPSMGKGTFAGLNTTATAFGDFGKGMLQLLHPDPTDKKTPWKSLGQMGGIGKSVTVGIELGNGTLPL
jgi:hypothetical protein